MRGQALVLALLVILVLSIMGLGLAYVAAVESSLAVAHVRMSAVFYAAESGLEYSAAMLRRQGEAYHGGLMPTLMSSGHGKERDIEITVAQPIKLSDDRPRRYFVSVEAHTTWASFRKCLEAEMVVDEGVSVSIREWKERPCM